MLRTAHNAGQLLCPFIHHQSSYAAHKCSAGQCMAWQWRDESEGELLSPIMYENISTLELSNRTLRNLTNDDKLTIGDVCAMSERELLRIPNMGKRSLNELIGELNRLGIKLDSVEVPQRVGKCRLI